MNYEIPRTRRKIHTGTKWLVFHNALPEKFLKELDKSQISRYRNIKYSDFYGNELFSFSDGIVRIAQHTANYELDRKMINGFIRLATTVRNIFSSAKHFHQTLNQHKEQLTDAIQRIREYVSVKTCSKFIGVAESTIRNWFTEIRVRCSDSLVNICRKVHPNQLLHSETDVMRTLLADVEFRFWPLRSLYFYALNNRLVTMCESTWYKYARLINIKRLKPKCIKIYKDGIRATKPNQYWHADVTYFKTGDGMLHYIYTVVDNFSRFPLVVKVSTKLSGAIRTQTFRDALKFAVENHPTLETINLIVDGGSENFNGTVDEFLNNLDMIEIKRIRALKDIAFSNSMAEALNRIMKTYYLNNIPIENTEWLERIIEFVKEDFAYKRPHGLLNGLTPFQTYCGKRPELISFSKQIADARIIRTAKNQKYSCGKC